MDAGVLASALGTIRRAPLLAVLTGLLATSAPAAAATPDAVPNRLIVKFKPGADPAERERALAGRAAPVRELGDGRAVLVRPQRGLRAATASLARNDAIEYVEPDYVVHAARAPNDPLFERQWHLENRGQTGGRVNADIDATDAWNRFIGGPAIVAILDTGADLGHPDLKANLWTNPNETRNGRDDDRDAWGFVDDLHGADFSTAAHGAGECDGPTHSKQPDGDPDDQSGHGTHLAGIVGAAGDNGTGLTGVSWSGVQVMPLKFLDACGDGSTSDAIDAIDYAKERGATILNASWGGPQSSRALRDAIAASGLLFVSAAGNGGSDARGDNLDLPATALTPESDEFPAEFALDNILVVAATDDEDLLAGYSNFGVSTADIGAPGTGIVSTARGGRYESQSGTSQATAVVSAAAGLVGAAHPGISTGELRAALIEGGESVAGLLGRVAGSRRLNVDRSLGTPVSPNSTPTGSPPAPTSPPSPAARGVKPAEPRLVAPRNGSRLRSRRVRFRWRPGGSATEVGEYRLYVNRRLRKRLRDPDGAAGPRTPRLSATLRLRAGRRYTWYLKAFGHDGARVRAPARAAGSRAFRVAKRRRR